MAKLMDRHGYVKLAPKVGDRPVKITHYSFEDVDPEEVRICLECKAVNCNGRCAKILDYLAIKQEEKRK